MQKPANWLFWYLVAVLSTVILTGAVWAADATLTWTHPTQRVDGTSLPLASIKETQIDWAPCATGNTFPTTATGTKAVPAPATTTTVTGLVYGTWCFRARTVDVGNLVSDNTGTVWKQYLAPPNPPVLTVVNIVAYEVLQNPNGIRLGRNVGTVKLGTQCVAGEVLPGFYEVTLDQVTLTKMPKSAIVVAQCAAS